MERFVLSGNTRKVLFAVGMGAVFLGGAFLLYIGDPSVSRIFPPCPFHLLTGLWCPGCGSARALHALLHGKIREAADFNILLVIALPLLAYATLSHVLFIFRGRGLPRLFVAPFWGWIAVAIICIYWIARNIPVYPFTFLAP